MIFQSLNFWGFKTVFFHDLLSSASGYEINKFLSFFFVLRCIYHCYGIGNRFANRDITCYFISVFLPVFCICYVYEAGVSLSCLYIRKYLFTPETKALNSMQITTTRIENISFFAVFSSIAFTPYIPLRSP
jgi:hypothetical protein